MSETLHECSQMNTRSVLPLATRSNLFACQSKNGTQELSINIYETFMVIHGHLCDAVGKEDTIFRLFFTLLQPFTRHLNA